MIYSAYNCCIVVIGRFIVLEEVLSLAASRTTLNSPDWQDLAAVMDAISNLHDVDVSLCISRPERGKTGLLTVKATAVRKNDTDGVVVRSVSRSCPIGSPEMTLAAATIFRLLYGLDRDCGEMWTQEDFTHLA